MVGLAGLEPATSSLSVTRSNQLSYKPSLYKVIPLYYQKKSQEPDYCNLKMLNFQEATRYGYHKI